MPLPSQASTQLDHLRARAAEAADAAAAARQRMQAIAERKHVLATEGVRSFGFQAAAAEAERLDAELPDLHAAVAEAEAAATLHRRCESWALVAARGDAWVATKTKPPRRRAGESWSQAVHRIRQEIADLQSQQRATESAAPSREETVDALKQRIAAMAVAPLVHLDGRIEPQTRDVLATLAWLQPDVLLKRLTAELPDHVGGLSKAAKRSRLFELRDRLAAAEQEEESLVRAAEAAGESITRTRRADAPIAVVLGLVREEAAVSEAA